MVCLVSLTFHFYLLLDILFSICVAILCSPLYSPIFVWNQGIYYIPVYQSRSLTKNNKFWSWFLSGWTQWLNFFFSFLSYKLYSKREPQSAKRTKISFSYSYFSCWWWKGLPSRLVVVRSTAPSPFSRSQRHLRQSESHDSLRVLPVESCGGVTGPAFTWTRLTAATAIAETNDLSIYRVHLKVKRWRCGTTTLRIEPESLR